MDEPRFQNALTLQAQVVTSTEFCLCKGPLNSKKEDLKTWCWPSGMAPDVDGTALLQVLCQGPPWACSSPLQHIPEVLLSVPLPPCAAHTTSGQYTSPWPWGRVGRDWGSSQHLTESVFPHSSREPLIPARLLSSPWGGTCGQCGWGLAAETCVVSHVCSIYL